MDSAQLVYQQVQTLPYQQIEQVLDFIENLQNSLQSKTSKSTVKEDFIDP